MRRCPTLSPAPPPPPFSLSKHVHEAVMLTRASIGRRDRSKLRTREQKEVRFARLHEPALVKMSLPSLSPRFSQPPARFLSFFPKLFLWLPSVTFATFSLYLRFCLQCSFCSLPLFSHSARISSLLSFHVVLVLFVFSKRKLFTLTLKIFERMHDVKTACI